MQYSWSAPMRYYCQIYTKLGDLKPYWNLKRDFISPGPLLTKFSRFFLATDKNGAVVFSHKTLSNIFKYRDDRRDLLIIWEDKFFQTNIRKSS